MKTLNVPSEMPKDLRIYAIMLIGRISTLPYLSKGMAQREFAQIQKDISALREFDFYCRYWDLYDDLKANLNAAMSSRDANDDKTLGGSSPAPKRRGRPPTGKAMSAGEKQRNYRQRQRERLECLERHAAQVLVD